MSPLVQRGHPSTSTKNGPNPTTGPQDLTAVSATRQTLDVVVDFGHIPLWPSHWNTAGCVFTVKHGGAVVAAGVCLSFRWLKDGWRLGRKLYAWYTLYIYKYSMNIYMYEVLRGNVYGFEKIIQYNIITYLLQHRSSDAFSLDSWLVSLFH